MESGLEWIVVGRPQGVFCELVQAAVMCFHHNHITAAWMSWLDTTATVLEQSLF